MLKKPLLKQQKAFQEEALMRAEFKRFLDKKHAENVKEYKKRKPEAAHLDAQAGNRVFLRTPKGKGKTKVYLRMVVIMLNDPEGSKKQVEILKSVQSEFPEISLLPNMWNNQLSPFVLQKIKGKIDRNMSEPISIRGLKKLSEIRKAIQATRKIKGAPNVFTKKIALSKQEVIIGKTVYRVELRNKGKASQTEALRVTVKGKRYWINYAPLSALLLEEG